MEWDTLFGYRKHLCNDKGLGTARSLRSPFKVDDNLGWVPLIRIPYQAAIYVFLAVGCVNHSHKTQTSAGCVYVWLHWPRGIGGKYAILSLMLQGKTLKFNLVLSNASFRWELPWYPRHYSWRTNLLTMSKGFGIRPSMWSTILAIMNT